GGRRAPLRVAAKQDTLCWIRSSARVERKTGPFPCEDDMKRALTALVLTAGLPLAGDDKPAKVDLGAHEKALLELLNKERKKEKGTELVQHPLRVVAARRHAENMARQEKLSHQLDGKGVGQRVAAAGYDYRVVGENLAHSEVESGDDPPPSSPAEVH